MQYLNGIARGIQPKSEKWFKIHSWSKADDRGVISRRKLLTIILGELGSLVAGYFIMMGNRRKEPVENQPKDAEVFLIETSDRKAGIRKLLSQFDLQDFRGRRVCLKANFNSADPFPASTHIDTLESLVEGLKEVGVRDLTLAERSEMGNKKKVLRQVGVFDLSAGSNLKVAVLDDVSRDVWVKIDSDGTHWLNGFYIPKILLDAEKVVQTCCLKTHRFGGHFTMSLKNSIGLVAKRVPGDLYDYMVELHSSPHQRDMISEVNRFYDVDLIVVDAVKAFVTAGPERGDVVEPNLLLASTDRVVIDAIGIAILRSYGSTKEIMNGRIFEQDQIRKAAEIGVGVKSASNIKLTPLDDKSRDSTNKIEAILESQG